MGAPRKPKGKLLIIGGSEDKGNESEAPDIKDDNKGFRELDILSELLPENSRRKYSIEVITTASEIPIEMGERYTGAFTKVGFKEIGLMHIRNKQEASDPELLKRIERAHAVFFTGGDQFRLATILGGTPVNDLILQRYNEDPDFVVAGTSAGAMAASSLMIYEGDSNEAMLKGDIKISSGLFLIDHCIIDTHFVKRGRFGRLAQAVITNPSCIGIGLGEDTALIIRRGNEAECRGSGMVIIIDGKDIGHTNIAYVDEGAAICVENLRVHILCRNNGFLLEERTFIPAKEDLAMEKAKG